MYAMSNSCSVIIRSTSVEGFENIPKTALPTPLPGMANVRIVTNVAFSGMDSLYDSTGNRFLSNILSIAHITLRKVSCASSLSVMRGSSNDSDTTALGLGWGATPMAIGAT